MWRYVTDGGPVVTLCAGRPVTRRRPAAEHEPGREQRMTSVVPDGDVAQRAPARAVDRPRS